MQRHTARRAITRGAFAFVLVVLGFTTLAASAADPWRDQFRIGDRVELHIIGELWQQCVVSENHPDSVLRGRCEEFVEPPPGTYRRAGGTYILSPGDTRHAGRTPAVTAPPVTVARPPRPAPATPAGNASGSLAGPRTFRVGDRVEIEASAHWVPCVVTENQPPAILRVRCEAYPALSRDAGVYTVDRDNPEAVRRATGQVGPIPTPPPAPRSEAPAAAGLKVGEYACYGTGGRILAGLSFKVLTGGRYTDLEDGNAGTFTVSGGTVRFSGGHLGGQSGRDLRGHSFTIGAQAECEPY